VPQRFPSDQIDLHSASDERNEDLAQASWLILG
jgi:hypothetical protein